jgi:hypothetical protein
MTTRANVKMTFELFKNAVRQLQNDCRRGDLKAVEVGLEECSGATEQLEQTMLAFVPDDACDAQGR